VGWLARAFGRAGRENERSRLSGVAGIIRWWQENPDKIALPPDELDQAIGQARHEFLAWQAALKGAAPPEPQQGGAPGGASADAGQVTVPAPLAPALDGGGGQAGAAGSRGGTGEIASVIYGQLSRIEGAVSMLPDQASLAGVLARLDAIGEGLVKLSAWADAQGRTGQRLAVIEDGLAGVLAWQQAQDERLAPLMALIEDLQAADEAGEQARSDGGDPAMARDEMGAAGTGPRLPQDPPRMQMPEMPDSPGSSPMPPSAYNVVQAAEQGDWAAGWAPVPDQAGPPAVLRSSQPGLAAEQDELRRQAGLPAEGSLGPGQPGGLYGGHGWASRDEDAAARERGPVPWPGRRDEDPR
jgi:hypothetical protein